MLSYKHKTTIIAHLVAKNKCEGPGGWEMGSSLGRTSLPHPPLSAPWCRLPKASNGRPHCSPMKAMLNFCKKRCVKGPSIRRPKLPGDPRCFPSTLLLFSPHPNPTPLRVLLPALTPLRPRTSPFLRPLTWARFPHVPSHRPTCPDFSPPPCSWCPCTHPFNV